MGNIFQKKGENRLLVTHSTKSRNVSAGWSLDTCSRVSWELSQSVIEMYDVLSWHKTRKIKYIICKNYAVKVLFVRKVEFLTGPFAKFCTDTTPNVSNNVYLKSWCVSFGHRTTFFPYQAETYSHTFLFKSLSFANLRQTASFTHCKTVRSNST